MSRIILLCRELLPTQASKLLLMLTLAALKFLPLQAETASLSSAPASQNPDSANVIAKDTFDVTEAKILIVYPKGRLLYKKPHRPNEIKRGGSFVSVDFLIQYGNVTLQEILFHTFESCSVFAIGWEKAIAEFGDEGEGFPKRWYSPDDFKKQNEAMQRNTPLQDYIPILVDNTKYLNYCQRYSYAGASGNEYVIFFGDTRVMIVMMSDENCDKIEEACKNLLSKIELKPYQPKKK